MKTFVLYSLNSLIRPKLLTSFKLVNDFINQNPSSEYKEFTSRLEAEKFMHPKTIEYLEEKLSQGNNETQSEIDKSNSEIEAILKEYNQKWNTPKDEECKIESFQIETKEETEMKVEKEVEIASIKEFEEFSIEKYEKINTTSLNEVEKKKVKHKLLEYLSLLPLNNNSIIKIPKKKIKNQQTYVAFFDGCSKNNPGQAGCGYAVFLKDSAELTKSSVMERAVNLGYKTNNEAEFSALLYCVLDCHLNGILNLDVYGDSQLAIRAYNGEIEISHPKLVNLLGLIKYYGHTFHSLSMKHIMRENNSYADKLSNKALKEKYYGGNTKAKWLL